MFFEEFSCALNGLCVHGFSWLLMLLGFRYDLVYARLQFEGISLRLTCWRLVDVGVVFTICRHCCQDNC